MPSNLSKLQQQPQQKQSHTRQQSKPTPMHLMTQMNPTIHHHHHLTTATTHQQQINKNEHADTDLNPLSHSPPRS
jgi:calcineurin-like phosphoesterase family protein